MKRKALMVALICIMGLATLSIGSAGAAEAFYTCTVSDCGSNFWGFYTFTAVDTNTSTGFGTARFFIVDNGSTTNNTVKAEYAAALTAWSNSGKVIIFADPVSTACFEVRAAN